MNIKSGPGRTRFATAVLFCFVVGMLTACAQKGPILLEAGYRASQAAAPAPLKTVVGVSLFRDDRGKTVSLLGKRSIRTDIENDLVVQGTVAELVTNGLKSALVSRGFTVKDAAAWDLTAETLPPDGTDILIGGEVQALWVDVVSLPLNVTIKSDVRLRAVIADVREKKIIRSLNLSSKVEAQDVAYSFANVEDSISEALSSALNQLLNDDEFKKKIQ